MQAMFPPRAAPFPAKLCAVSNLEFCQSDVIVMLHSYQRGPHTQVDSLGGTVVTYFLQQSSWPIYFISSVLPAAFGMVLTKNGMKTWGLLWNCSSAVLRDMWAGTSSTCGEMCFWHFWNHFGRWKTVQHCCPPKRWPSKAQAFQRSIVFSLGFSVFESHPLWSLQLFPKCLFSPQECDMPSCPELWPTSATVVQADKVTQWRYGSWTTVSNAARWIIANFVFEHSKKY